MPEQITVDAARAMLATPEGRRTLEESTAKACGCEFHIGHSEALDVRARMPHWHDRLKRRSQSPPVDLSLRPGEAGYGDLCLEMMGALVVEAAQGVEGAEPWALPAVLESLAMLIVAQRLTDLAEALVLAMAAAGLLKGDAQTWDGTVPVFDQTHPFRGESDGRDQA